MARSRDTGRWLSTTDAAFSMGERVAGWIISGGVGSIISSAGGTLIGWLSGNLLYGLMIGMGVEMLVLMGFAVKAIRIATSASHPVEESNTEGYTPQPTPTDTNSDQTQEIKRLTAKLREAEREIDVLRTMSPEEFQARQNHRQEMINAWRAAIGSPGFDAKRFTNTSMYSEMSTHLRPEVRNMLENPWAVVRKLASPPREQGQYGDKRMLLDEVARIEKEWGLV